jgi:hypothetical protein
VLFSEPIWRKEKSLASSWNRNTILPLCSPYISVTVHTRLEILIQLTRYRLEL